MTEIKKYQLYIKYALNYLNLLLGRLQVPGRPPVGLHHVSVEVPPLGGRLLAVVALVARQPRVDPPMSGHTTASWEFLSANITFIRLFVHVHGA